MGRMSCGAAPVVTGAITCERGRRDSGSVLGYRRFYWWVAIVLFSLGYLCYLKGGLIVIIYCQIDLRLVCTGGVYSAVGFSFILSHCWRNVMS